MLETTSTKVPVNLFLPKKPYRARVLSNRRLTFPGSPNDIRHINFFMENGPFPFLEGQSMGVITPGKDLDGKPHKLRLYSIASSRYGEDGEGKVVGLCVKRHFFQHPISKEETPGLCSNFLCDLKEGDEVELTGPVGRHFLLPPITENTHIIMAATGTGIAPFRGFLKYRYYQSHTKGGKTILFFGVQTRKDFLYVEEYENYKKFSTFELYTSMSREIDTPHNRRYVQHRMEDQADQLLPLLKKPETTFYMCGLKAMEPGILSGLRESARLRGEDFEPLLQKLILEKRWKVEVY